MSPRPRTIRRRGDEARLADEQTALRRLATLVGEGVDAPVLFSAVVREVAHLVGAAMVTLNRYEPDDTSTVLASLDDPAFPVGSRWALDEHSLNAIVLRTGRPARIDDYSELPGEAAAATRGIGVRSGAAVPIVVGGTAWGVICVGTTAPGPLPADLEHRLAAFTDLLGTAVANTESRLALRRLVEEQAALRHVATLVAEGGTPEEVFSLVAGEISRVLGVPAVTLDRFEDDGAATTILGSMNHPAFPAGSRWPLDEGTVSRKVFDTGRAARVDDYSALAGAVATAATSGSLSSAVGVPIVVDGKLWGVVCVSRTDGGRLPDDTETRLRDFKELFETAISNADARDLLREVADEQAALRRVATLVAREAPPDEIFAAIATEASHILELDLIEIVRYDSPESATIVGSAGDHPFQLGSRWRLDGPSISAWVLETGRVARIDEYHRAALGSTIAETARAAGFRSAVGAPIVVDGRTWGVIIAVSAEADSVPEATETKLTEFTDLAATAISKLQARDDLRALVDEQTALRRVATLIAEAASPTDLLAAVAEEVGRVLGVPDVTVDRYDPDGMTTVLATVGAETFVPGSRWPVEHPSIAAAVLETGRPARIDDYSGLPGRMAAVVRASPMSSGVGAPIVVGGSVWGLITIGTREPPPLPASAERRLAAFTELVATAVSNAAARAELVASRARIVAAGDQARRRVERNLHDGAQQRLVALGLDVQAIRSTIPPGREHVHHGLEQVGLELERVLEDIRELSRGLHPALLARGGLHPSLRALARRSPIPVTVAVTDGPRPPEPIEIGVYYVVSEALTNAAKHSRASEIQVTVAIGERSVRAVVADDGIGGATAATGSGLSGLADRVEALGGTFRLESPPGAGTTISIELPLDPVLDGASENLRLAEPPPATGSNGTG